MRKINIPCDCEEDMEHEVEVEAEWGYRAIGLYCPEVGDTLPCGRLINDKDIDYIIKYLEELNVREDE